MGIEQGAIYNCWVGTIGAGPQHDIPPRRIYRRLKIYVQLLSLEWLVALCDGDDDRSTLAKVCLFCETSKRYSYQPQIQYRGANG